MAKDEKTFVTIPYDLLPNAQDWRIGRTYRVKFVLKQTSLKEDGATFEIQDATSLEPNEARKKYFASDSGSYGGKL